MEKVNFKKKFGQNFLTDKNLLKSIVQDAKITSEDVVLEIGAGAGALTSELCEVAKKVVSFEIDKELEPILSEKFAKKDNVEFIYADFLDFDEQILLDKLGDNFKVVANIPYYITSPILNRIFSLKVRPNVAIIMVQKEVADRIVATPTQGNYGYFSVVVQANANAKIMRQVDKKMFTPVPKVDSAIVKLSLKENTYEPEFYEFLKKCFMMKRKTLLNNLEGDYPKTQVSLVLLGLNKDVSIRADALSIFELYEIYNKLKCNNSK